jgi:integrase
MYEIFNEFIQNVSIKDQWKPDIINTVEMIKSILFLHFDKNMDVNELSQKNLMDFTNMLFQIPNRLTLMKQFKDKNLDYIISNSKTLEKLSITTINKYILRINQFLTYCKKMDYIQKELIIDKINDKKIEKSRDEYDENELKRIIENLSNISQENALVIKIAMYSGMRLNEIIQLTKNDIKQENDIFYFDVNSEDEKRIKNQTSIRRVPIHDYILDEIIDYMKSKESNLFSMDAKQYSKWYRTKFNRLYITKDEKKVFHSFRHGFVNQLIQKNVRGEHIASVVGHAQELSITFNTYGNKINLKILKDVIDKIQF